MFPFWDSGCYSREPLTRKGRLERKRKFLQLMQDDLETRLAGIKAAIAKLDEQLSQEDAA